jgi:hypothetical protein
LVTPKPYEDHHPLTPNSKGGRNWYRIVKSDSSDMEMVWHTDGSDRKIRVVYGHGWRFQFDNELPISLQEGDEIIVKTGTYHRLLMGYDNLVLNIEET